jgi:hypothetical protein
VQSGTSGAPRAGIKNLAAGADVAQFDSHKSIRLAQVNVGKYALRVGGQAVRIDKVRGAVPGAPPGRRPADAWATMF